MGTNRPTNDPTTQRPNDTQREQEITLDDIADLRPPAHMNRMANLRTFRCTKGRVGIIPQDPDLTSQSIYRLWQQCANQETVPSHNGLLRRPPTHTLGHLSSQSHRPGA